MIHITLEQDRCCIAARHKNNIQIKFRQLSGLTPFIHSENLRIKLYKKINFEILDIKRRVGYKVRDIFNEDNELFIYDKSLSETVKKYDIQYIRPYPIGKHNEDCWRGYSAFS
jgi:cupin superfamily acireductone dioxygenase involved in methionine salvage